jgi:tetratricopeptide (TPR) repeat protein
MCIRDRDSIIHWSDYQDGKFTYGLLSQISPNGRYVVSTLKDCEIFVDRKDLEYSQLFFPFKGILVIYDKLNSRYFELEGANDTAFVQSNPCWSPDGKYIYYTKARARHFEESGIHHGSVAKPEDAARYRVFEKHFLNRDSLVKFDIYKIPFNEGKGGIAEPVPGASNNGYSNYFPKVSPDGKWLVFCRAESFMLLQKDSKLFMTSTDGGEVRQMTCNTDNMNSWHSWSPNSKWLVFASKAFGPYTQLLLTHVDEEGKDSPPVLLERFSFEKYANNIPEFVNVPYDGEISIHPAFLSGDDFLVRTGEIKLKEGDIDGAFQAFDKAVRLFPEKSEPYYKRGKIYHEKKQVKQAITDFNKAIQREDVPSYYTSRGIAYLQLKNYEEAKKDLNKALELDPTSYTPWTYLGVAYTDLDENGKAIECLQKSVSLYGEDAYTHYYLGLARCSEGQWDKANQALSKAVRCNPDKSIKSLVFTLRARARLQLEDVHGAIQDLTVAIQMSPNDPSLYYLRGRAQLEIGRRDEARANLSKAAQMGSSKAKAILKRL